MTMIKIAKNRNPTLIITHDDDTCEFSLNWELGDGFTNVVISLFDDDVALLILVDDVNVDDIISLTGDDVTSLAYIVKEMYKF